MKLKITKRVHDKEENKTLEPGTEIERSIQRGEDFIKAGVAEKVEEKPKKKSRKKKE